VQRPAGSEGTGTCRCRGLQVKGLQMQVRGLQVSVSEVDVTFSKCIVVNASKWQQVLKCLQVEESPL